MAIAGALIGKAIGAFGRKPDIPALPAIDPNMVQAETIAQNKQQLPQLEEIGKQVNQFNLQQQLGMLQQALNFVAPGQLQQVQGNTAAMLRGEIPADVAAQVQRRSAAQAAAGGYGAASGIGQNLSARDFGLTSLNLMQQGLGNFQALAALAPRTPLFDVSSMFFSPQQRLQAAFAERDAQFQRNLLAEQIEAAPDPATAAIGREVDRFFNTAASFGMTAAGGAMG